ncbi:uncharacterized protein LOC113380958 [Ctenocephalides felis]|uniref:uncharacterized protein LOC113380958 n=1 Tax=Ctenocephalides felis TaxID=7515 RepID=UPI000E6E581D|nr:uncharacterized protein LOC113380958 [Ctenocephalides felis]
MALRNREVQQSATAAIRENNQRRVNNHRALVRASLLRLAFNYDPEIDYSSHSLITIGNMDKVCKHCLALKFRGESAGLCCASGKIILTKLTTPPEPLKTLLDGTTSQSKILLKKNRKFNSCFQMTSFGATKVFENEDGRNFESTFRIQGQVYHQIGSLFPMPDVNPKFLHIYFMGDDERQTNMRCEFNHIQLMEERDIVNSLKIFSKNHNQLLHLFKTLSSRLENDDYAIIIRADKVPVGEHAGAYNVPTVNEVAVVIAGDLCEGRDIRIQRRDNTIQIIQDSHRSYDALQYPLIFWKSEDGYLSNIKQRDPNTGAELAKKVSAMDFYCYRLMIRANRENNILKCRQLFHQFVVDMYVKIESERLRFIKFNQAKLRAEEYIHLRDAVLGNVDAMNDISQIGTAYILPSSYIGSPRHMQEYIQDAMAYVRAYGRPDLFITFTYNPKWDEIKKLLMPGQTTMDRHDITARVFKQKLKSLINLITHHSVFGETRCWLYSVEWQKRGLPHAHILLWLINKVRSVEIDNIISAEIPDKNVDEELFDIITTNMIHGPCGTLTIMSPMHGSDKAIFAIKSINENDEITRYQMGRYVSSNEAIWRIFGFPIHERNPSVVHLAVHLENDIAGRFARTLLYTDTPKYFTWDKKLKDWVLRKRGIPVSGFEGIYMTNNLGRLYTVHPKQRECFYLRLLLINVVGPRSFQNLRTVNGILYETFYDACRELHLLENDNQWDMTLADAALISSAHQIRQLFAIILTTCFPSDASALWNTHKDPMSEDILHRTNI